MQQNAYAKLNLALAVTGQRRDGYHLLDSIFCPVDLCDTLALFPKEAKGLTFTCSDPLLGAKDNLVVQAATLFSRKTGIPLSLRLHLEKRIPVQSGLGGGSADAAATLRLLDMLCPEAADCEALIDMALSLGADVPQALVGGMQRARGIGEVLTPVHGVPPLHFVVLKPHDGLSTPAVFHAYDLAPAAAQPDMESIANTLINGDLLAFSRQASNALQTTAQQLCPDIASLCCALRQKGALYAAMTGTGSAVFGLFAKKEQAQTAAGLLNRQVPFCVYAQSI